MSLLNIKKAIQDKRMPFYQRAVRWMWYGFGAFILGIILMFVVISMMDIPSFTELENPHSALASEVIAADGSVLGRYYIENRVPVSYDEISPHLIEGLIATEDERFRKHVGIDIRSVARVIVRTILLQDQSAGGGSTITQQLAKNLYSDRDFEGMNKIQKVFGLFYKKFREWITAVKLERAYTKNEILAMYLNQFNFVNNAYGIRAASEIYFGKSQKDLNIEESAMLVGMLQNPSRYNPLRFPEKTIRRRMVVLYQMKNANLINETQYDSLKVTPLDLRFFRRETPADDKAPYFCMSIRQDLKNLLKKEEHLKTDGTKYDIFKDGLKVYTTIDPTYQKYAEEAVFANMRVQQKRFFKVWRGKDPWRHRIRTDDGDEGTTDREIEIRQGQLQSLMRRSDRYASLRKKYLSKMVADVSEKFEGFNLRDADIRRMMEEERAPGYFKKLIKKEWISKKMEGDYKKIMATPIWTSIKKNYRNLQSANLAVFRKKIPMKVFSYSKNMESDTILSPLDSIKYHRMFLQTGMMAMDPKTGFVKAWVGGINYKWFQYDHIRTDRQVGSTFKPFVYATAISQQGMSPCFQVYDQPVTIPQYYQRFTNAKDWTPKNARNKYSGELMTLKDALRKSVNSVSAYLMKQMGDPEPVRGLANNMGIDSSARRSNGQYRVPKQPSICLGASDLSVMEMTAAYSTFANNGVYNAPQFISRIEDRYGRVIYRATPFERTALSPESNFALVEMLKYVVSTSPGTRDLKSEVGGKTGTTNDYTDGWFMGVTPSLVVGTWVGGEDRWVRFLSLDNGQGGRMARPTFVNFMKKLEADPKSGYNVNSSFKRPVGDLNIEIDCAEYQDTIPTTGNEEFYEEMFNDEIPEDAGGTKPAEPKGEQFGDEIFGDEF